MHKWYGKIEMHYKWMLPLIAALSLIGGWMSAVSDFGPVS